jgi:outer membrane protein assembly factor BamB/tRNA A-37 threonylcarbamoyl transferase component Bud32
MAEESIDAVIAAYLEAEAAGAPPDRSEILARHPELAGELRSFFADHDRVKGVAAPLRPTDPADVPTLAPDAREASFAGATARCFGDYELLEEIARGGMGVVYKARQISLNRVVALKLILAGQLADEGEVRRFQAEAQTAAGLQHPNIVAIHAVGQHDGQHYFSMDYVEGRNLTDRVRDHPLPPRQAAGYVQTVAAAIHYAHQKGVLHRDLKPSNILVDAFDQPRVTDFGLAKRLGDKGLTATGAVLGTPSYMPPEQAAGDLSKIGPASDVYSLGAVLYELVTGRPPFQAATALDVLRQVLETEPAPPRLLNPGIDRDLETVILKCLAKQPGRRYAGAQDLADDLAAYREGRPIKARRPGWVRRALRWMGKQRRSAVVAATAAAVAVLLAVTAFFGWRWYVESQQGSFQIATDGGAFRAEVLDENGEAVVPSFTVPNDQPMSLPSGAYRLRLSAPGRLSQTYQLLVEQGRRRELKVDLNDWQLWNPIEVSKGFEVADLDGRPDVILVTEKGMRRVDGRTGKDVWPGGERSLAKEDQPALADATDYDWATLSKDWLGGPGAELPWGYHPWLVKPEPDLTRSGAGDLVWASTAHPWLLAVSGKDGKVLWHFRLEPFPDVQSPLTGSKVGCPPLVVEDVDGDGVPDVVVVFARKGLPNRVEAISGGTGRSIWGHEMEPSLPQPYDFFHDKAYGAVEVMDKGERVIAVCAGSILTGLDLKTGNPVWPVHQLDFRPVDPPIFTCLDANDQPAVLLRKHNDGRGEPEALIAVDLAAGRTLWQKIADRENKNPWPGDNVLVADLRGDGKPDVVLPYSSREPSFGYDGVQLLDGATGKVRWARRLTRARQGPQKTQFILGPDLDGDGRREIFVASLIWGETFDYPKDTTLLVVSACSGADGRVLWQSRQPVTGSYGGEWGKVGLHWRRPGADGRPELAVTVDGVRTGRRSGKAFNYFEDHVGSTFVFSSASGKLEYTWPEVVAAGAADFNGDGVPDLFGVRLDPATKTGKLHALRGGPPELWRRLGPSQPAVAGARWAEPGFTPSVAPPPPLGDLDGDGIPDVLEFHPAGADEGVDYPLQAFSGKDGRRLWRAEEIQGDPGQDKGIDKCYLLECRDLKGDGRPEVIFIYNVGFGGAGGGDPGRELWLAVLSGRTGKVLWKEKLFDRQDGYGGQWPNTLLQQQPGYVDLNGDGVLDLVVVASAKRRIEIRALDGRDGRLLWSADPPDGGPTAFRGVKHADGSADVFVASVQPNGSAFDMTVSALGGRDGKTEWQWPPVNGRLPWHRQALDEDDFRSLPPVLADLEGDGRPAVCVPTWDMDGVRQIAVLSPQGNRRQTLDFEPSPRGKEEFHLWSLDLKGDGKDELVFVVGGKVQAVGGDLKRPRWEWPLPDGVGDIFAVVPAAGKRPAFVVARSGNAAYGLDGPSGELRWRCDGPGRPIALWPGGDPNGLPGVIFALPGSENTVCRQALPVDAAGRYVLAAAAPFTYGPEDAQPWRVVPLPWVRDAKKSLAWAIPPALVCLGLLLYFISKRRWRVSIGLALCLLVIPLLAALVELRSDFKWPEERYDWHGWYWVWPYALSAPPGWSLFRSPLTWMAVWLVGCWYWRRREAAKARAKKGIQARNEGKQSPPAGSKDGPTTATQ